MARKDQRRRIVGMTCAGAEVETGRGVYLTGGHRRHARERRASSVVARKRVVRRTWGEARVALADGWGASPARLTGCQHGVQELACLGYLALGAAAQHAS